MNLGVISNQRGRSCACMTCRACWSPRRWFIGVEPTTSVNIIVIVISPASMSIPGTGGACAGGGCVSGSTRAVVSFFNVFTAFSTEFFMLGVAHPFFHQRSDQRSGQSPFLQHHEPVIILHVQYFLELRQRLFVACDQASLLIPPRCCLRALGVV